MLISRSFWSGKRVLVTGHTGFKGSWLALWLQSLGAEVMGYALEPPTDPSLWRLVDIQGQITHQTGDVRDFEALSRFCARAKPDVVFHMAAQPLVQLSYREPIGTYATNVMGTVHLLEAVRSIPSVRVVVVVTSDKCYENRNWMWGYRENEPMGGRDPYSSSKGCAELVTAAYRQSFFANEGAAVVSVRAGNVIGGGDWAADRIVPDFVRARTRGASLEVRNPKATRPWQHVLEPLCGYMTLAQRAWEKDPSLIGGWNFGPNDEDAVPVEMLISRLEALWEGGRWTGDPGAHPHEEHFLKLDSSKARALLGWRPRLGLPVALAWTVEWYKAWSEGADMRALCLSQIGRYETQA